MSRLLLLVLVVSATATSAANAATLYVAPGGSGTTCSIGSPCGTINAAYQSASPGDTVQVATGSYSGTVAYKSGATSPAVTISPAPGATVSLGSIEIAGSWLTLAGPFTGTGLSIDGAGTGGPVSNVLVQDVTVDGGNQNGTPVGYLRGVNHLTWRRVDIGNNNNFSLILADQDASAGGLNDVWIDQSKIHDAHLDANSPAHTECLYAQGIANLKITRSHFYRCAVMDVFITRWSGTDDDVSGGYIENNIFEAPLAEGNVCCAANAFHFRNGSEPAPDIDNWDFRYNLFLGEMSFGDSNNVVKSGGLRVIGNAFVAGVGCKATNATYSYNAYSSNSCGGTGALTPSASTVTSAMVGPTTAGGSSNDFHLTTGSPLIDAGNASDMPTVDFDGVTRTSVPEVGPYEFEATDTTPPNTTITSSPPASTSSTSASFAFTGTDDVGVTGFECSLDGGAYATCTSPKSYTSLAVGSHTFAVRAKDAANNVDASPATASWTVIAFVGRQTITPTTSDYSSSGEMDAWKFTSQAISATKICGQTGLSSPGVTSVDMAIYGDGPLGLRPGSRLVTATFTGTPGTGTFCASISATSLPSSGSIWVGWLPHGAALNWEAAAGTYQGISTYASPPSTWPSATYTGSANARIWTE